MDMITEYKMLLERKAQVEDSLKTLPQGYISHKNISGKTYAYLQNRIDGKVVSSYLKADEEAEITQKLILRKEHESELSEIDRRIEQLETEVKATNRDLSRTFMLLKISSGMDTIAPEQKADSISFANAMNAIEGIPVSVQTARDIGEWQSGQRSFLSVFEGTLRRYGFPVGGTV